MIACGTSSRVRRSAFSRITSPTRSSSVRFVFCSPGKYAGPSGRRKTRSPRSSSTPSLVTALTGCSAWKSPSCDAACICESTCPRFSRSILLRAITTGFSSPNTRRATKRSPAPIRARASTTRSTASTSSNDASTVSCIFSVNASSGRWKPGKVDESQLEVRPVCHPEEAASGRVGHVRGDRDLFATEGVDERRLADVRPARDGDEAGLHGRLHSGHPIPPPTAIVTRKCARMGYRFVPKACGSLPRLTGDPRPRTTPEGARSGSS